MQLTEFNERDHLLNLFNGMYIGMLTKESKDYFKANKHKVKHFLTIRNQYNFNSIIDNSFIRNKQNFIATNRERLHQMNNRDFVDFLHSDKLGNEYGAFVPDLIIDISGIAGVFRNKSETIYMNMNYNFYLYHEFIEFINEDLEQIIKSTNIPYDEKFFKIGSKNTENFLSSIVYAYNECYPSVYPNLFKEHGYEAILQLLPLVITAYKRKSEVLGDDEMIIKWVNSFINNYLLFDQDIANFSEPFMI
jgi:hypothetical protein